jgi:hypothetical protein
MSGYGIPGSAFLPPPFPGQIVAPMEVPKAIRRVGEQAFWSTQAYAAAAAVANTTQRLFTTPLNQAGQGFAVMSLAETNLLEAGRVPSQFAFTVDAVACQIYMQDSSVVFYEDVANLVNDGVLSWIFTQTNFEIAPCALIGAGGGVFGATSDTGGVDGAGPAGSREALNNGNGNLWVYRRYPVLLPSNTTFSIGLTWGINANPFTGGSNVVLSPTNVRVSLVGRFEVAIASG